MRQSFRYILLQQNRLTLSMEAMLIDGGSAHGRVLIERAR